MATKDEVRIVLISSVSAILVGLMSSLITGMFLTKSNNIIAEKDVKIINAQNTQKNLEMVQSKAEVYIDSVMDLIIYLQSGQDFDVAVAKQLSMQVQKNGFKLMVYVGPELAGKSIDLSVKLQNSFDFTDGRPLSDKMKELQQSAAEWYKAYFTEMTKYNYQSMPNKLEADAIALLLSYLSKS
ncbi:hypothetical protein [Gallaecimonas pentaromativorans]|uniref:hypothetical protein n=1 Tax=Gallaecimonas pentaromativorans TaxID=584787 RepID=UPI003A8D9BB6